MTMKAFVVIFALVACALAQTIPENMCSVHATGSAVILVGSSRLFGDYTANMYRVGDYARYDIKDDSAGDVFAVFSNNFSCPVVLWKNCSYNFNFSVIFVCFFCLCKN